MFFCCLLFDWAGLPMAGLGWPTCSGSSRARRCGLRLWAAFPGHSAGCFEQALRPNTADLRAGRAGGRGAASRCACSPAHKPAALALPCRRHLLRSCRLLLSPLSFQFRCCGGSTWSRSMLGRWAPRPTCLAGRRGKSGKQVGRRAGRCAGAGRGLGGRAGPRHKVVAAGNGSTRMRLLPLWSG